MIRYFVAIAELNNPLLMLAHIGQRSIHSSNDTLTFQTVPREISVSASDVATCRLMSKYSIFKVAILLRHKKRVPVCMPYHELTDLPDRCHRDMAKQPGT